MRIMKKLLMMAVILAVVLAAGAYATEPAYPEPFAGKVVKIALDSGYQLNTVNLDKTITISGVGTSSDFDAGNEYTVENVPVFSVSVPEETENVYFYILQDSDASGGYFSYYGNYYMGIVDWNTDDGSAAMEWYDENQNWIFQQLSYGDDVTNIFVDEENGVIAGKADGGTEVSLYRLVVPVPEQNVDGSFRLVVFENEGVNEEGSAMITFPFALYFSEDSTIDASTVTTDYINVYDVKKWDATVAGNETKEITAEIFPKGAVTDASSVTWTSDNESIVTVESTGETEYEPAYDSVNATAVLTPQGVGTANITAKCGDYSATCSVEITAANVQSSAEISLDQSEATLWNIAGQTVPEGYTEQYPENVTLTATVSPEDAEITWSSSDETVATVENGVVTAVGAGETTITASAGNVSAECKVTVSEYVEQAYTNVAVENWQDSANKPDGITAKVIDLSDETQPRTVTIVGSAYKNVGTDKVKTLSTIQDCTWNITGDTGCVTYTTEGNTVTLTVTGEPGVVNVQPVLLNGYKNVSIPLYITEGFAETVSIVREDGKDWQTGTVTINGTETEVIQVTEGSAITAVADAQPYGSDSQYFGWLLAALNDSGATVSTKDYNQAGMDLSSLNVGLYRLTVRVPKYEYGYNIDPYGINKQPTIHATVYLQVTEAPEIVTGDVDGDGKVNATDARRILLYTSGNVTLTEDQLAAADINGDGRVNSTDARRIMLYNSGNIDELS